MTPGEAITRRSIRTPRAAAIAGIVFAVLLTAALTLIQLAVPSERTGIDSWISEPGRRRAVVLALGMVPFAGIAFLWFIGVVRDRIGEAEDRFFATVFLGSGLLFVAMLFVSSAIVGGIIASVTQGAGALLGPRTVTFGREVTHQLSVLYGLRMAAVFVVSTSTILLRERVAPRWIAIAGYVVAVALLFTIGISPWVELLFPAWVFVLSVYILIESFRRAEEPLLGSPSGAGPPG